MFNGQRARQTRLSAGARGLAARAALLLAGGLLAGGLLAAGALARQAAAPRYSIGIPSFDEIPLEAIPPAPAPVKRAPPKPAPLAKSPGEQAAFDGITREQRPDERIQLVEDFLLAYPDSEFRQAAYLAASDAYRRKNDLPRMLTYAELTLAEDPENLQALLTLAEALPESVRRDDPDYIDRVDEAAEHAHRALEVVGRLARPAAATPEQWQRTRRQVEAAAQLALALAEMMREDYPAAEAAYLAAFRLVEQPDALSLYRLGLTYSFQKKFEQAIAVLQRAVEAGGVRSRTAAGEPRELAAEALAHVEKQKAEAAPQPEPGSHAAAAGQNSSGGAPAE